MCIDINWKTWHFHNKLDRTWSFCKSPIELLVDSVIFKLVKVVVFVAGVRVVVDTVVDVVCEAVEEDSDMISMTPGWTQL